VCQNFSGRARPFVDAKRGEVLRRVLDGDAAAIGHRGDEVAQRLTF
jgi:hypothetical protein